MNQSILIPFGSADSPRSQQNRFHEAMKRIAQRTCSYPASARDFLKAFHNHHPEAPKPIYRQPLADVVRRS